MSIDINQLTVRADLGLEIARGRIQRTSGINRFAFIPTVGTNYETVWENGGTYAYPPSALAMTATSAAGASDAGVEITIIGLDANWRIQSETVTLNASGTATTIGTFIRINEVRVSNGQAPTGKISVTNSGITYAAISTEFGKSLSSVYTVPAGYKAYIVNGNLTIAKQKEVIAKLMVRPNGGIFTAEGIIGSSGAPFSKQWIVPIELPAKTDIEVRAKAGATTELSTAFEIILVEID